jgi:hypothetical protein
MGRAEARAIHGQQICARKRMSKLLWESRGCRWRPVDEHDVRFCIGLI